MKVIADALMKLVEVLDLPKDDEWYTVSFRASRRPNDVLAADLLTFKVHDGCVEPSLLISTSPLPPESVPPEEFLRMGLEAMGEPPEKVQRIVDDFTKPEQ